MKNGKKRGVSFRDERVPKKARTEKLCDLLRNTEVLTIPSIRGIVRSTRKVEL